MATDKSEEKNEEKDKIKLANEDNDHILSNTSHLKENKVYKNGNELRKWNKISNMNMKAKDN